MLKNRVVILAKEETTYNTDPTPTGAANAILVEDPKFSFAGRRAERKPLRTSLASLKSLYAGALINFECNAEIKGSGAAGTAPELGVLLRACAMTETIVAVTSVTYTPASSGHKSCTIYFYEDGLLYKFTGCRGNVSCNLKTADKGIFSFKFTGHFSGPTDTALATPTYNATVPSVLINVPFSIGAYSAVISALNFDMGHTIATPDNIAATDGYSAVQITGRKVTGGIDPEGVLVAANDFITQWKNATGMALDTGLIGGTAGNRYRVQMPVTVYTEIGNADRDGVITRDAKFMAVESTTDDEVSIAFT